jgi:hypothetical protein
MADMITQGGTFFQKTFTVFFLIRGLSPGLYNHALLILCFMFQPRCVPFTTAKEIYDDVCSASTIQKQMITSFEVIFH